MHVVTNLSNALLELSLDETTSIQMADTLLTVRRQTSIKLAEFQIGNAYGHLNLTADFEVDNTSFVDMQVKSSLTIVIFMQFISAAILSVYTSYNKFKIGIKFLIFLFQIVHIFRP